MFCSHFIMVVMLSAVGYSTSSKQTMKRLKRLAWTKKMDAFINEQRPEDYISREGKIQEDQNTIFKKLKNNAVSPSCCTGEFISRTIEKSQEKLESESESEDRLEFINPDLASQGVDTMMDQYQSITDIFFTLNSKQQARVNYELLENRIEDGTVQEYLDSLNGDSSEDSLELDSEDKALLHEKHEKLKQKKGLTWREVKNTLDEQEMKDFEKLLEAKNQKEVEEVKALEKLRKKKIHEQKMRQLRIRQLRYMIKMSLHPQI